MVLNAAVQILREAEKLKETITKFKNGTSMLQEHSLWTKQQQLQKIYQKVLILDLDYALDKKVEQDLWNVGFKQQIEALQAISKDRKNPLRSEGQAMLSWVLQAAAGFYLCLLHQICTTFQLDLPFRRRASLLGSVEGWGADGAEWGTGAGGAGARYLAQHCLVHLGDVARYGGNLRAAHAFYRHALAVSPHSGQPYNQLALVAWRRARRLPALYWHVRSVLVRAPFPPAPANLARTLRAAALAPQEHSEPVLAGVVPSAGVAGRSAGGGAPALPRLDAHSYVTQLIRALHYIHTEEQLDTAEALVDSLNSSLSMLIATDSFESMTLIKMSVVLMWCVHVSSEELRLVDAACSATERRAAGLALSLAAGTLLALLLPACAAPPSPRAMPAVKVWLDWTLAHSAALRSPPWVLRPALWPALAHTLNTLRDSAAAVDDKYTRVPLPEDEELLGFLPLAAAHADLCFLHDSAHDAHDTLDTNQWGASLEAGAAERVRAHRLLRLGRRLADLAPHLLTYTEEDGVLQFSAASAGGEQLRAALATLTGPAPEPAPDSAHESDDDAPPPPPPTVISEADFREKVRERRAGILKPQGSLERAREERAQITTELTVTNQEEGGEDGTKSEEKKEARRPRVNIAMAAIMRKQEETNKQVKFVTPPPTPEKAADGEVAEEKPKVVQPKPAGARKTGGILALKDKSGYPHLVNAPPSPRPTSPPSAPAPPIRLPVVNPREIDVRSAALQRQSARRDPHEAQYVSGDKRNFLNDLPPRFANRFRQWQEPREPPAARWPPECPPAAPDYCAPHYPPPDTQYAPRPAPTLQSLVTADYGASRGYGPFAGAVPYDAGMYPQFAPPPAAHAFRDADRLAPGPGPSPGPPFGAHADFQRMMAFGDRNDFNSNRPDRNKMAEGEASTYSLFSAAPPWPAAHHPHQSLWSGPGPSPLERLLEQQKQGSLSAPHPRPPL